MGTVNFFSAKRVKIYGFVQGVGFRPFIYRMAKKNGLVGEVSNSFSGVDLVVEGDDYAISNFLKDITRNTPPISRIDDMSVKTDKVTGFTNFSIVKTKVQSGIPAIISPDVSICDDCLKEIKDVKNRRYRYPFTNCTNCGPRYSITNDIPYDRCKTTMNTFKMCSLCQSEYDNPNDRRFHAQPNACAKCGPALSLFNSTGDRIYSTDPIVEVSKFIKKGFILAVKGLGGFHLIVDATNDLAVRRLRRKKKRKDKPFALMSANIKSIRLYTVLNEDERKLLSSIQRPIVLLKKNLTSNSLIAESVSPKNKYFGVMLPYTPLHYLIFEENFFALVMTSGNLSGEPIFKNNESAFKFLGQIADYFLFNDRDIAIRNDDSILRCCGGENRVLRRARGYTPSAITLLSSQPSVLACGAEMKNTICLTRENNAFISQHIGGLNSKFAYDVFLKTIDHMQGLLRITPEIVACDYHPNYASTRYAIEYHSDKIIKVQHHHAHIVACMVENKIDQPVIGLAFDGTGFGTDGTVWGGEILIVDYSSFKRVASLELIPMPSGSMAIKEPWRMGISYLYRTFGESLWDFNIPLLKSINEIDIKIIINLIYNRINTPYTSSMGRFFDGIAAIVGIRNKVTFEGQAAMEFESLAADNVDTMYDLIINEGQELSLMISPIIKGVVNDIINDVSVSVISAKFHNTIIEMSSRACLYVKKNYGIKYVALSGGVFQNLLLLSKTTYALEKNNFKVLNQKLIPSNDGGLSLGQAVIASHLI